MAAEEELFGLTRLVSASDIRLSARCENGRRQILAFVTGSGHLTLHYVPSPGVLPTLKVVNWFLDTTKRISAMTFDPSGTWLLVAGNDGTVYTVPALALVDPSAPADHRWPADDVAAFPTSLRPNRAAGGECRVSRPTAVAWWQCATECQHLAVVGSDRGDIVFVSLTAGVQVGSTYVKSPISELHVCQDNCLDNVFLLITGEQRSQWRLLIEERTTGYIWPLDNVGKASDTNADGEMAVRAASLPTARSRLQGLKQLSVEKLANMRQRLAEARSKGTNQKEVRVRRGSNGSSGGEETQRARKTSTSSDGTDWVATGPTPTSLGHHGGGGDTFLRPQFARGLHLLSGLHAASSILTIHGMVLEIVPLFVFKLPPLSRDVLLIDRFLFVTDDEMSKVSVVSGHAAESRLDGDADFNPDSVVESFVFAPDERIVGVYKRTLSTAARKREREGSKGRDGSATRDRSKSRSRERSGSKERTQFVLPKTVADLNVEDSVVDGCVVVTTAGVYEIALRRSAVETFMELVLQRQELEKAERLAVMFGLDVLKLLESAGDLKLAERQFAQAISLYKLSKCRHLKSVLKFAAGGHSRELLTYVGTLFGAAAVDLSASERIHLANLAVMAHADQVLRAVNKPKVALVANFLRFLRENGSYDPALAVTICGQAGRWDALAVLASCRGLRPEVLDVLARILRSLLDAQEPVDGDSPALDPQLWRCVTDPGLLPCLLSKPAQCAIVVRFVARCLPHLDAGRVAALADALDPSAPEMRPLMRRAFARRRRRFCSTRSNDSLADANDVTENGEESALSNPAESISQTFLLVLLQLAKCRAADAAADAAAAFDPELMSCVPPAETAAEQPDLDGTELPLRAPSLAAGFCHAALVRNSGLFAWGNTVCGCLGTGPAMSRYLTPLQVALLPALKLEVLGVSCGRQHTLALTNNGVYAWGSNQFGQLGLGGVGQTPWPALVRALANETVVQISAGQYHSLALTSDGRAFAWGWGVHGQLGLGSAEDVRTPAHLPLPRPCVRVAAGHAHSLLLADDGTLWAAGASVFGQLGRGGNAKSSLPVPVEIDAPVVDVATGYFHSLALTADHRLYTWGASPQVLRLQAQAQKKARLMQQQYLQQCEAAAASATAAAADEDRKPGSPDQGTGSTHQRPVSPDRATGSMHQRPVSPDGATSSTHQRLVSPDRTTGSTHKGLVSPDRATGSTHQRPVSPDGATSSTHQGPVSPDGATSSTHQRPVSPDRTTGSTHKGLVSTDPQPVSPDLGLVSADPLLVLGLVSPAKKSHGEGTDDAAAISVESEETGSSEPTPNLVTPAAADGATDLVPNADERGPFDALDERPMARKSFTQSVQDYFAEHRTALDSSRGGETPTRSNPSAITEMSELNQKKKESPTRPAPSAGVERRHVDVPSPSKVNAVRTPTGGEDRTDAANGVPSIVISPTLDDKEVKRATQAAKRQALRSLLLEDGNTAHLSPRPVDTSLVVGRIAQLACGCHHSALLTSGGAVYTWGRSLDGQLGTGSRREVVMPTALPDLRASRIACGCEFTLALDGQSGKVWAWGSNCSAQLGHAPIEDSRALEGKTIVIKTMKRVIKLPHGSQNSVEVPREVPRLPSSAISFRQVQREAGTIPEQLSRLSTMDDPAYGPRALHYALQRLHGHYDSNLLAEKCVELGQHQAAAKVSALDRDFPSALAHQLKALALAEQRRRTAAAAGSSGSAASTPGHDVSEIHLFSIQGGNEEMSEGRQELTSPSDTASSMSQGNSCSEIDKMASPAATDGGGGVDVVFSDANANRDQTAAAANANVSADAGVDNRAAAAGAARDAEGNEAVAGEGGTGGGREAETCDGRVNRRLVAQACQAVDLYVRAAADEGHATTGRLLQRLAEFWTSEALPVPRLEELLERHMDTFFYPLGLLLFNNSNGPPGEANPAAFLNCLSTRFCLRLCSALLTHIDQGSHADVVGLLGPGPDSPVPGPDQLVAAILSKLGAGAVPCVILADQVVNGCVDDRLYVFSCGHSFGGDEMRRAGGGSTDPADCPRCVDQSPGGVASP